MPIPTERLNLPMLKKLIKQMFQKLKAVIDQDEPQLELWDQILSGQDLNRIENASYSIKWHLQNELSNQQLTNNCPDNKSLNLMFGGLTDFLQKVRIDQMKNQAQQFFKKLLNIYWVYFKQKPDGAQQGFVVQVGLGLEQLKYFCKYHYNFEDISDEYKPGRVDLKEIYIYKLLQFLGIGPQTYFFYFDMINFHIATKDAGFHKDEQSYFNRAEFYTFQKYQKQKPHRLEDQDVKQAIILLDIINRMMGLVDTIDNESNFGFKIIEKKVQLKIVDSLPPSVERSHNTEKQIEKYVYPDIFQQWIQGYTFCGYDGSSYQHAVKSALRPFSRPRQKRPVDRCIRIKVKEAKEIFQQLKGIKFSHFTKQARRFILSMLKDPLLDPTYLELLDLDDYINGINKNYETLMKQYSQQLWLVQQVDKLKAQRSEVQI